MTEKIDFEQINYNEFEAEKKQRYNEFEGTSALLSSECLSVNIVTSKARNGNKKLKLKNTKQISLSIKQQ